MSKINWLKQEIAQGFMRLAALNLNGRPAAKDLTAVASVWLELLRKQRLWEQKRDAPRIRASFRHIALHYADWPNPKDFLQHLPPVPEPPLLENRQARSDYGRQMSRTIQTLLKQKRI